MRNQVSVLKEPREKISVLAQKLIENRQYFSCAESCTGGWLAKLCTDLAGSSVWFDSGFVTYSNHAKINMLGINPEIIQQHGAVSEAVAMAMASGVLNQSQAQVAAAITGIAGPGGGSAEKPVGTVCFAIAMPEGHLLKKTKHFDGDRERVRWEAVHFILDFLNEHL